MRVIQAEYDVETANWVFSIASCASAQALTTTLDKGHVGSGHPSCLHEEYRAYAAYCAEGIHMYAQSGFLLVRISVDDFVNAAIARTH
jgi:hypothetical protein